jgi:ATP-binding cassette subfamily F protein 3
MPLLSFTGIERHYGTQEVLRGAAAAVEPGDKVALVGPNGSGKTTLLRVLGGLERPDAGTISLVRGTTLGYLPQRPEPPEGATLRAWVMSAFERAKAVERELEAVHEALAGASGGEVDRLLERQSHLETELERRGGWDVERRAEAILSGLGFRAEQLDQPASSMSGGEKSRGALARILCEEPDLVLLDEPTNHLDLAMLEWLEDWLAAAHETVIVVSHDRRFLDKVATKVFALDRGKLVCYDGNYSRYLELRAERIARALKEREQFEARVEKEREFIRRFKAGQRAREAAGREKRLEREILERGDGPLVEQTGANKVKSFEMGEVRRSGHEVVRAKGLAFAYPGAAPLFERLDLDVVRGERVGVIGPNGSGKTTLFKVLAGDVAPSAGEVKLGVNLDVGFYRQDGEDLDPAKSALDEAHDAAPRLDLEKVRGALGRFGLSDEEQLKKTGALSGGERARVILAKLFLRRANLLLLDEPTNHLDLESREALEEALEEFDGTLVCVSHDRFFLDRVATRLVVFGEPGGVRLFTGNYSRWKERRAEDARAAKAAREESERRERERARAKEARERERPAPAAAAPAPAGPASRPAAAPSAAPAAARRVKRRYTFEELERRIVAAEERQRAVEAGLADPRSARDFQKLKDLSVELELIKKELAALNAEWETWA